MPHSSSTARLIRPLDFNRVAPDTGPTENGPLLESTTLGSRIRANRFFGAPPDDVLSAWTSAAAWESWMRLRSKSRAVLTESPDAAFRLEVAEGSLIHVITGELGRRTDGRLSLSWFHHGVSERASTISVMVSEDSGGTVLSFLHERIASRREASWLMRFWSTALRRLDGFEMRHQMPARHRRETVGSQVWYAFSSSHT